MTWKTHKNGAFTTALVCLPTMISRLQLLNLTHLQYICCCLLLIVLVYSGALCGTILPDLDQNKYAIPMRNLFTLSINSVLRHINCKHRSWQTHSIDLYILLLGYPIYKLQQVYLQTGDLILYFTDVLLIGFMVGAVLHCVMDLFTKDGVWISVILSYLLSTYSKKNIKKYRISLAPTWLCIPYLTLKGGLHIEKYYPIPAPLTGTDYEKGFKKIVIFINRFAFVCIILSATQPYWIDYVKTFLNTISNYY